jgi:hypothetical protein
MSIVHCPYCHGGMQNIQHLAGSLVACPHCGRQFTLPSAQPAYMPTPPRSKGMSGGTIAFIIVSILTLVFVGLPVLVCVGCFASVNAIHEQNQATKEERRAKLKKHALSVLAKHNIKDLSTDCSYMSGGSEQSVRGTGLGRDGRTYQVSLDFHVNSFESHERWEVTSLVIDGKQLAGRPRP